MTLMAWWDKPQEPTSPYDLLMMGIGTTELNLDEL